MKMRDAPGPSAVVKLAQFMLDSVQDDSSLIARRHCPDRPPPIAEIINSLQSAAPAPKLLRPRPVPRERIAADPAAKVRRSACLPRRQPVPFARYVAPAACVVAVLIVLVATMSTGPRQTQATLAPLDTVSVASSTKDAEATLADLRRQMARETDRMAQLTAERDSLHATIADLSAQAAQATRQVADLAKQTARQVEIAQRFAPVTLPVPRHLDAAPGRVDRPAAPDDAARQPPPAQPPHEMSSISRQLLRARVALVSGDTYEARRMMKVAQTLILFRPGDGSPGRAGFAAAQITQALMMLTAGNDERALGCLNQALSAVLRVS